MSFTIKATIAITIAALVVCGYLISTVRDDTRKARLEVYLQLAVGGAMFAIGAAHFVWNDPRWLKGSDDGAFNPSPREFGTVFMLLAVGAIVHGVRKWMRLAKQCR